MDFIVRVYWVWLVSSLTGFSVFESMRQCRQIDMTCPPGLLMFLPSCSQTKLKYFLSGTFMWQVQSFTQLLLLFPCVVTLDATQPHILTWFGETEFNQVDKITVCLREGSSKADFWSATGCTGINGINKAKSLSYSLKI